MERLSPTKASSLAMINQEVKIALSKVSSSVDVSHGTIQPIPTHQKPQTRQSLAKYTRNASYEQAEPPNSRFGKKQQASQEELQAIDNLKRAR